MSLYGAMFSGVSGLNAESQALGTIADNISNVNTIGYKDTSARFSTLVTQQATTNTYAPGGVNFARHSNIAGQGLLQGSASPTDLAVSGQGMFVVTNVAAPTSSDPFLYTRAGSFTPDQNGNLRNTAGFYLQGWATDAAGDPTATNVSVLTSLETVNVSGVSGSATPTSSVELGANLPATAANGTTKITNVQVFDSLGVSHDLAFNWTKSGLNQWDLTVTPPSGSALVTVTNSSSQPYAAAGLLEFTDQPSDGDTIVIGGTTYEFDSNASITGGNTAVTIGSDLATTLANLVAGVGDARVAVSGTTDIAITQTSAGAALAVNPSNTSAITQSATGAFTVPALTASTPGVSFNGDGTPSAFNIANVNIYDWSTGATDSAITLDVGTVDLSDGLTQFSGDYNVTFINQNGVKFGTFSGVSISEEGLVVALFDNGETLPIYKVPLVTFANANGLTSRTGNVYIGSDVSGSPVLRSAKSGGAGAIAAGALENSTVDLGTEFTNMIIAQRAYSATSRVITTADEMLDDLVRIKR
jgi:flagellar hook protein FlgE